MFTNLQLIFVKNFNQINRKQFRESLKGKKKIILNTFFLERDISQDKLFSVS